MGNTNSASIDAFETYKAISNCYIQYETNFDSAAVRQMSAFARTNQLASSFLLIIRYKEGHYLRNRAAAMQLVSKQIPWLEEVCQLEQHETFPYTLYILSTFLAWKCVNNYTVESGTRALALMTRAASFQYPPALTSLGFWNMDRTNGSTANYQQAIVYFKGAQQQNYAMAIVAYGAFLVNGIPSAAARNPQQAMQLFQQAAEQGHILGIEQYADGLRRGLGTGVPNVVEAFRWYKMGTKKGSSHCKLEVANCYALGEGVTQDHHKAMKWFRAAAEHEECSAAKVVLGTAIYHGLGSFFETQHTAHKLFLSAFSTMIHKKDETYFIACFHLGKCYVEGSGCHKDEVKALELFTEASKHSLCLMKDYSLNLIRLAYLPRSAPLIKYVLENVPDHQSLVVQQLDDPAAFYNFHMVRAELGYSMDSRQRLLLYPMEMMFELDVDFVPDLHSVIQKQSKAEALHDFRLLMEHGCSPLTFNFCFRFEDSKKLLKQVRETFNEIGCQEAIRYRER